jgi:hypothetical protein
MVPSENDTWKSLVAMVAKETDVEKLSRLAAEFKRLLSKKRATEATPTPKRFTNKKQNQSEATDRIRGSSKNPPSQSRNGQL